MKNIGLSCLALAAALAAASCSPQSFTMNMESRQPSKSGLELSGKTMGVVYVDKAEKPDTSFTRALAEGFARRLEKEYFGGDEVIGIYSIPFSPDTASVGSLENLTTLVMDTGADVVFLFDRPGFGAVGRGPGDVALIPFDLKLYAYDSMNRKDDKVYSFTGSSTIKPTVENAAGLTYDEFSDKSWDYVRALAEKTGELATGRFLSEWAPETATVIYYESMDRSWEKASQAAYEFRWTDAISEWMKLLETKNLRKRSCVEYNIALGTYLLGDFELAKKWLEKSDADCPLSVSPSLKKKIEARLK